MNTRAIWMTAVLVLAVTGSAVAAPMTSDVQALPSGLNATAVAGPFSGNDSPGDALNMLNGVGFSPVFPATPSGWSLLGKSDDPGNGPFTSNPNTNSGTLLLDAPIDGPLALSLKAGNNYVLYFFDGSFMGVTGFNFSTIGFDDVHPGNNPPDLSHATLFTTSGGGGNPDPVPVPEVPEPASVLIWLLAAVCLTLYVRKRKQPKPAFDHAA